MNTQHQICWSDLATSDDWRAGWFYEGLFGWRTQRHTMGAHYFATFHQGGSSFASLYRIATADLARGVPSHWLPYVSTQDLELTLRATLAHGGEILVGPQMCPGFARIAVIADPTGAMLGLWEGAKTSI